MKNHVITVRLSENLKENLSDVADIQGITISEYIRQLIESRFVDALWMNFLDSSFAIGESAKKTGVRYLKRIKQRNTEEFYHENNVAICKINNPHNFLQFQFQEFGFEQDHLKHYAPTDLMQRKTFVCELKKEGLRNTEIAKRIGVVEGTIRKILKELPE